MLDERPDGIYWAMYHVLSPAQHILDIVGWLNAQLKDEGITPNQLNIRADEKNVFFTLDGFREDSQTERKEEK